MIKFTFRIVTVLAILVFAFTSSFGQFSFEYTGPDTLFVNSNCEVPLEWGHPDTPTATSTIGATVVSFDVDSISNDFVIGENVNAGQTILVMYKAVDDQNNVDFFSFYLEIVDTIIPVITVQPTDESYTCETDENTLISNLHDWYNNHGGMVAEDNCGEIIYIADKTLQETETEFNQSVNDNCGNTRRVTVTFTAKDQFDNSAVDAFSADFFTFDNTRPEYTKNPVSLEIVCNEDADSILEAWIDDKGGARAEDNCTDSANIIWKFNWSDNKGGGGFEEVGDKPYQLSAKNYCDYAVTVYFIAEDECGNTHAFSTGTTYNSYDDSAPVFSELPADTTIDCSSDIPRPDVTAYDDCKGDLIVLFSETDIDKSDNPDSCNYYSYTIEQKWMADDECGNDIVHSRTITVIDTTGPEFDVPPDIEVECTEVEDLSVTGTPENVIDNCDENLKIYHDDEQIGTGCQYHIKRTWTITDACQNSTVKIQDITVIDSIYPVVVHEPSNITLSCDDNVLFEDAFNEWIETKGNAQVTDNCNKVYQVAWVPGTYTPGDRSTYPGELVTFDLPDTLQCSSDTVLYYKDVDFVFFDRCFNTLTFTRRFSVVDITKPEIHSCPNDTSYVLPADECSMDVRLLMPDVTDNCAGSNIEVNKHIVKTITSPVQGSKTIPVDPVILEIGPFNPNEVNATEILSLVLDFNKLDANGQTEYFVIYGENGEILDTTSQVETECSQLVMDIGDKIPLAQFKSWILDGYLTLTLIPNQVVGYGDLSINDICGGSSVTVDLLYTRDNPNSLRYNLKIDDGDYEMIGGGESIDTLISKGNHTLSYKVLDCGNNAAICTQNISIIDAQKPVVTCPKDISVELAKDSCTFKLPLPLDLEVSDNCSSTFAFEQTVPASANEALIDFNFNTDLNKFVANSKVFSFENISNDKLIVNPVLKIKILGDIDEADEYFEILSEDGAVIGNTSNANDNTIAGSCSSPAFTTIKLDSSLVSQWADDGVITFTARPVINTNSINPCDDSAVADNGDNDGISKIFVTLEYEKIDLSYYIDGVTKKTLTSYDDSTIPQFVDFAGGKSEVFYIINDGSDNKDTCSFNVEIVDSQAPKAVCEEFFVLFVNPNGVSKTTLDPQSIGFNSYDNCEIDSMSVFPNSFDCSQTGNTEEVTLYVKDKAGLVDSCSLNIKIDLAPLQPTYKAGICFHDTLKLFANLPDEPDGTWTIDWNGPLGFASNVENPIRPNADATYSGTYSVTATGLNGCQSTGFVEVSFEDLSKPVLTSSKSKICSGEEIVFETNTYSSTVKYYWYEGSYPDGTIIDSTSTAHFAINPVAGNHNYYVVVKSSNCESLASASLPVSVLKLPVAEVEQSFVSLCEGEVFQLNTTSSAKTYHWWGPDGFDSNQQTPPAFDDVSSLNQGTYYLAVSNDICSDTAKVELVVLPRPMTPEVESDTIYCEGSDIVFSVNNITNADTYIWYHNGSLFKSETSNTLVINDANPDYNGDWTVVVKNGNCYSDTSGVYRIEVEGAYSVEASNSGPVCEGDTITLYAPPIQDAEYKWTGPNGYESSVRNPVFVASMTGEYKLVVTTKSSCEYYSSTEVVVRSRPKITALSNDAPSCINEGECVKFYPSVFPNNTAFSYQWTGPNGFTSSDSIAELCDFNTVNNGLYSLIISDGFCSSDVEKTEVDVNLKPLTPELKAENQVVCEGDSIKLLVSGSYDNDVIFHWVTPKDGEFDTKKPYFVIPLANMDKSGEFTVYVEDNGCVSDLADKIDISVFARPNQPFITGTKEVCEGGRIEFKLISNYGPNAEFSWSGPNNYTSNSKEPIIFPATLSNAGVYVLTVSVNGCESVQSDGFFVDVIERPGLPEIAPVDSSFCVSGDDSSIELCLENTEPGTIYSWYINNNVPQLLVESANRCVTISDFQNFIDGDNSIYVIGEKKGCESDESTPVNFVVNIAPNRNAETVKNVFACNPDDVEITANPDPNGKWYALDSGTAIENPEKAKTKVFNLDFGDNYFVWSLSHGVCLDYSRDTTTVYLEYVPDVNDDEYDTPYNTELDFEPMENDSEVDETEIIVTGVGDIQGKLINNGDGSFTYIPDPEFIGTIRLKYTVSKLSCPENSDEGYIVIKVGDGDDCFGVNVITPNGDGINDELIFPCLESGNHEKTELIVFNQWGSQVYRSYDYKNDWSGTYNRKDLPVGTYYYILYPDGNKSKAIKGFFVIER